METKKFKYIFITNDLRVYSADKISSEEDRDDEELNEMSEGGWTIIRCHTTLEPTIWDNKTKKWEPFNKI